MKAVVNEETCVGCGLCVDTCTDVFEMPGDIAKVIAAEVPPPEAEYALFPNKVTEFTDSARDLVARCEPIYTENLDGVPLVYVFDHEAILRIQPTEELPE